MAKKETVNEIELNENALVSIEGSDGKALNVAELLSKMNSAEAGTELTSEFFTLEPGEEERVILLGLTQINAFGSTTEQRDAVELIGKDGLKKICGDIVVTSTARQLNGKKQLPKCVVITCKGKVKGNNGSYKEFSIKELLM